MYSSFVLCCDSRSQWQRKKGRWSFQTFVELNKYINIVQIGENPPSMLTVVISYPVFLLVVWVPPGLVLQPPQLLVPMPVLNPGLPVHLTVHKVRFYCGASLVLQTQLVYLTPAQGSSWLGLVKRLLVDRLMKSCSPLAAGLPLLSFRKMLLEDWALGWHWIALQIKIQILQLHAAVSADSQKRRATWLQRQILQLVFRDKYRAKYKPG